MSDQDRALQRFRVHANRIDEILAEFRAHYKGSGEDGDGSSEEGGDESGGEPVQSLDALLAAIEALEAQAEGFKDQADNLADALRGTDRDISRAVNSLTEQVALLNAEADALRDAPLDRADPDTIGLYEKDVYSAGQRLGEIRSRISALTISVCEAYEQVKATNNVDRLDNIYGDMTAQLQEVDRLNTEYKRLVGQMKSLKQRAEQEAAKAGGVSPRLESAESRMGSLVTQASGIADQIGQMQAAVDQIRGVQGQVSALAQEAVTLVDQAHALPVESLERREKKLVKKIDRAMGKIRKDEAAVIADASRAEGYAGGQQGALAGGGVAYQKIAKAGLTDGQIGTKTNKRLDPGLRLKKRPQCNPALAGRAEAEFATDLGIQGRIDSIADLAAENLCLANADMFVNPGLQRADAGLRPGHHQIDTQYQIGLAKRHVTERPQMQCRNKTPVGADRRVGQIVRGDDLGTQAVFHKLAKPGRQAAVPLRAAQIAEGIGKRAPAVLAVAQKIIVVDPRLAQPGPFGPGCGQTGKQNGNNDQ